MEKPMGNVGRGKAARDTVSSDFRSVKSGRSIGASRIQERRTILCRRACSAQKSKSSGNMGRDGAGVRKRN